MKNILNNAINVLIEKDKDFKQLDKLFYEIEKNKELLKKYDIKFFHKDKQII